MKYQTKLVIPSIVTSPNRKLIAPYFISDDGKYSNGQAHLGIANLYE